MESGITATIATSIMPKRIEVQQAAIRSWQRLGFKVVSINIEAELAILPPLFENVEFISAGEKAPKSPLIPIPELLGSLKKGNSDICGIVNSDIILSAGEDFLSFLWENTKEKALIFGHRIDVADIYATSGSTIHGGYDYFFFRQDLPSLPLPGNFSIGSPWWDFWFAITLAINGARLRQLIIPVGLHPRHPQSWDLYDFELGRREFVASTRKAWKASKTASTLSAKSHYLMETRGGNAFIEHAALFILIEAEQVNYGQDADSWQQSSIVMNTALKNYMESVLQSRSWRWTFPARYFSGQFRYLKCRLMKLIPFITRKRKKESPEGKISIPIPCSPETK